MSLFTKTQWMGLATLIALFTVVAYIDCLDSGFVFDDVGKIVDNPDVQIPEFKLSNFIYPYDAYKLHNRSDPSRPLTFMLFWLAYQADGGKTWPFHVENLLIHAISAFLLAILAAMLAARLNMSSRFLPAVIVSLWFLTLPLNAGTVIYSYGLSDVLATMFMLGAMVILFNAAGPARLAAAGLLYTCALASKQSAIVLPGLVMAIDFFTSPSRDFSFLRKRKSVYLTLGAISLAYLGARLAYFGRIGDLEAFDQFRVSIYLPLQGIIHWEYVARLFIPLNLAIEHAQNPQMYTYPQCFLTWTIILAVAFACLRYGRNSKWLALVALGWCCLFIALSPTSTFFTTTDLMVERRAYTPAAFALLAWGVLLGGALPLLTGWPLRVWSGILVLLLGVNTAVARERTMVYGNEDRLWSEVLANYPADERAMVNLVTYYLRVKNFPRAKQVLETLLGMYPGYYSGLINFGAYYQHPENRERDLYKAEVYYKQALEQEPTNLSTLMNSGLMMLDMGKLDDARKYFGKIVEINPKIAGGHFGLARTEYQARNYVKAKEYVVETLRLAPEYPLANDLYRIVKDAN